MLFQLIDQFKGKVKENIELVEGIYSLVVEHEAKINAGQFYMIKTPNTFLGRPISVCEVNGNDVRFVYATVGAGTNEMKKMISGDEIFHSAYCMRCVSSNGRVNSCR